LFARTGVTDVPILSTEGQRSRLALELDLRNTVAQCVLRISLGGGRPHIMSTLGRHLCLFSVLMWLSL